MEHLSNDPENRPNQHENSNKQWDETGYPVGNMIERQWKLKQQHYHNFPMEEKLL